MSRTGVVVAVLAFVVGACSSCQSEAELMPCQCPFSTGDAATEAGTEGGADGATSGSGSGGLPAFCVLYPTSTECAADAAWRTAAFGDGGGYCAANAGVDNPDAATPVSDSGCSGEGDAARAATDGG